tara:strand:- start:158 stop:424 length:267 start_codon:yes stop_codon:yes gene_type:complete
LKRQPLLKKLTLLRTRIEEWSEKNGYENMENYIERYHTSKSGQKTLTYKRSDWEHVDALHDTILNDNTVIYAKRTLKELNEIWKKYEL